MRRVLISLAVAVGFAAGPVAVPSASAACYKHYFRIGTWVWECR